MLTIIIILSVLALLLFALEALVIPGFGITGVGAALCAIGADVLIYYNYGTLPALLALLAATAIVLLFLWYLSHSKTLDKMSLHATILSTNATQEQLSVKPGDEGHALTRLALIGNANIGGKVVEVKSAGDFIEEGTPIIVTGVCGALIMVKKKSI